MLISVIVSTYNRPDALSLVLQSLNQQTDTNFEIIVADDGSRNDTKQLVESFKSMGFQPLTHVWHEDTGFRLAAIRNLAATYCTGEYFIFLDGDCVVQPDFIARHRCLSEKNHMVTGSRVLLNKAFTASLIEKKDWDFSSFMRLLFVKRLNGSINKFLAFHFKFCQSSIRYYEGFKWRGIKGCNFACWRSDYEQVKGYDESFEGWGHEDADMVFRLHCLGVKRKSGSFATEVLHLYHPENNRSQAEINKSKLLQRIANIA